MISMICSMGKNRELGRDNNLIWHIPKDMKFFRETTMGHTVVMGMNTYKSLPGNLPGRKMIVLSRNSKLNDVLVVSDKDTIIDKYLNSDEEIFVIGGAKVYEQFINYADNLYITLIDAKCDDADTFFPVIDENCWNKTVLDTGTYNDIKFEMCKYERKK